MSVERNPLRECDLFPPVRSWLEKRGCVVHVEHFDADAIGIVDGRIIVVELKKCFGGKLFEQLGKRARWADEVWAAIPTYDAKKRYDGLRTFGFGLLDVRDGKVTQRIKAKQQPYSWHKMRSYRMKKLLNSIPAGENELAGLPACGLLREQRAMRKLLAEVKASES